MTSSRILVVEDDAILASQLENNLLQMGYQVTGLAATGEEAIKAVLDSSRKPDAILMDIRLRGEMTGIQAAEVIHKTVDIPVIYLTAYNDEALLQSAKIADGYAFLSKPMRKYELRASLEMAFYRHRIEKRVRHLNQVLRAIRGVSQVITRELDPQKLQQKASQILLTTRGYKFIWIGVPDNSRLRPVAMAGEGKSLIDLIVATVTEEQGEKLPGTQAARKKQVVVCQDMQHDDRYAPWQEAVRSVNFFSTVAVPMLCDGRQYGVISVYSDETSIFDSDELGLLMELASDLAFGLKAIDEEFERKRAVNALVESEERFQRAFHASPAATSIAPLKLNGIVDANDRFFQLTGYDRAEVIGHNAVELGIWADPDDRGRIEVMLLEQGFLRDIEISIRTKSGALRQVIASFEPINVNGIPLVLTNLFDITERKAAELALRESEERYRLLLEHAPVGIAVHMDGKVVFTNLLAARQMGAVSPDEIVGREIRDFVLPDRWESTQKRIQRMVAGEKDLYPVEDTFIRLDGSLLQVEITAAPFRYQGKPAIQLIINDISKRK
jgi:PAS domain S-box-containing protein